MLRNRRILCRSLYFASHMGKAFTMKLSRFYAALIAPAVTAGGSDRGLRAMPGLLRAAAAACRHLLSASGRAATVPYRRGNRDRVARRRHCASHPGTIPHRHAAADRDRGTRGRPDNARRRHTPPPARRNGRARAVNITWRRRRMELLRLLTAEPAHKVFENNQGPGAIRGLACRRSLEPASALGAARSSVRAGGFGPAKIPNSSVRTVASQD